MTAAVLPFPTPRTVFPVSVRVATPTDAGWILAELAAFADFYGTKRSRFPNSLSHANTQLLSIINDHLCLVAEDVTGYKLGVIAGLCHADYFNPDIRCVTEVFWWVAEDSRGGRAGLELLAAFTERAESVADEIRFSLIEGRSPVNERCLTKRGFHLHERCYLRES